MGSMYATCMISGLPITPGVKFKLIFLQRNKYVKIVNPSYEAKDYFSPASLPIDCKYDDYMGFRQTSDKYNSKLFSEYLKQTYSKIKIDDEIKDEFGYGDIYDALTESKSISGLKRKSLEPTHIDLRYRIYDDYNHLTYQINNDDWAYEEYEKSDVWVDLDLSFCMIRNDIYDYIIQNYEPDYKPKVIFDDNFEFKFKKILTTPMYFEFLMRHTLINEIMVNKKSYEKIGKDFTDLNLLHIFLTESRKLWFPQTGYGSQSQPYKEYLLLSNIVSEICNKNLY